MSPEQARGKIVDRRADIWAFGVVLYEMLTGQGPFVGDTISDVIAKVIEREPDWTALPAATPASVRRLLTLCLRRTHVRACATLARYVANSTKCLSVGLTRMSSGRIQLRRPRGRVHCRGGRDRGNHCGSNGEHYTCAGDA